MSKCVNGWMVIALTEHYVQGTELNSSAFCDFILPKTLWVSGLYFPVIEGSKHRGVK